MRLNHILPAITLFSNPKQETPTWIKVLSSGEGQVYVFKYIFEKIYALIDL